MCCEWLIEFIEGELIVAPPSITVLSFHLWSRSRKKNEVCRFKFSPYPYLVYTASSSIILLCVSLWYYFYDLSSMLMDSLHAFQLMVPEPIVRSSLYLFLQLTLGVFYLRLLILWYPAQFMAKWRKSFKNRNEKTNFDGGVDSRSQRKL